MSSMPPPPPPPPAMPPPASARGMRQAMRDQRRAATLAARQQQALYRAQIRASRRSSLLGPVLLVSAGIVFLLLETGLLPAKLAMAFVGQWWPLVLVGAGVVLLAEWAFDRRLAGLQGTEVVRRRVGFGGGLMLVLITTVGLAATALYQSSTWARQNWGFNLPDSWGLEQLLAQHTETTEDFSTSLPHAGLLTIQNYRGNITVTGTSPDGKVHVTAHQRLWAWQSSDLQRQRERDRPRLEPNGNGVLLRVPGDGRDEADLTIDLPHEAGLEIAGETGEVDVSELRGPVTINDHHGNVVLTALTGDVHVSSRDDDATISGHSLTGVIGIEGHSGDITLSNITGPVTLHGDFFGTTHLERVQGAVRFQSSVTDLTFAGLPGDLDIDGRSDLRASDLVGPVVLTTTDRNLTLDGVHNGAVIHNRNGSVSLSLADPLGTVEVTNGDGSVDVRVPEKAAFQLDAGTTDGNIGNDFGLKAVHDNDRVSLHGQVKSGGPQLRLRTSDGDIQVHKAELNSEGHSQKAAPDEDSDQDRDAA